MIRTLVGAAALGTLLAVSCAAGAVYQTEPDTSYDTDYNYEYDYDQPPPDLSMFSSLDGYGTWVDVGAYGWVWRPSVDAEWQPYYYGHWAFTTSGWMWISYEPFGWAVYHYGTWERAPRLGWIWIPGRRWYPSRVDWYVSAGYVCWAPMAPPGIQVGVPWDPRADRVWVGVRAGDFCDPDVGSHHIAPTRFKDFEANTRSLTRAPRVRTIEKYAGRRIARVPIALEHPRIDGRRIARARLPLEQQRIIEQHRVQTWHEPHARRTGPPQFHHHAQVRTAPRERRGWSRGHEQRRGQDRGGRRGGGGGHGHGHGHGGRGHRR